jgi:hypothetical protein
MNPLQLGRTSANPEWGGGAGPSGNNFYLPGTPVQLVASAASGYTFNG